jgi:hypothetical protein
MEVLRQIFCSSFILVQALTEGICFSKIVWIFLFAMTVSKPPLGPIGVPIPQAVKQMQYSFNHLNHLQPKFRTRKSSWRLPLCVSMAQHLGTGEALYPADIMSLHSEYYVFKRSSIRPCSIWQTNTMKDFQKKATWSYNWSLFEWQDGLHDILCKFGTRLLMTRLCDKLP